MTHAVVMQSHLPHRLVVALHLVLRILLVLYRAVGGASSGDEPAELRLLVLSPYPSQLFASSVVGWAGGPALFPAALFAADTINNRTDILPRHTLRLIDGDSGCALAGKSIVTFAREREKAMRDRRPFLGIVGPACSPAALEIGGITTDKYADVASITIANGPLLAPANLTNTLRLYSSARLYARALFKLMEKVRWTSVAAIVDVYHYYFPQIYRSFRDIVGESPLHSIEFVDFQRPFASIQNRHNVILVFAGTDDIAKYLCIARKRNLVFPDYQWIFFDVEARGILVDNVQVVHNRQSYSCSRQDMEEAADKAIVVHLRLTPGDRDHSSGLNLEQFNRTYEEYYSRHLNETGIAQEDVALGAEQWAPAYFDSVWAFALAINQSLQNSEDPSTLATTTLRRTLLSLDFQGLTGRIHFHEDTLEVPSVMDLFQLDKEGLPPNRIGSFYEGVLNVSEDAVFVPPIQKEVVVVHTVVVAVFFLAGIIVLAMIAGVHLIYVVFRHYQSIRAQSPHFVHIIFSGCYLYILAALLDTIRAANWTGFMDIDSAGFGISIGTLCNAIVWCLCLSTALIFGTMCVLSWRIYRIFAHFLDPGVWISDPILAGLVGLLATINVAVLVAWSTHDPLLPRFVLADEGLSAGVLPFYQHCDCKHFISWLSVWALNEVVIFLVVVLAAFNRHVPRKDYVNNTRSYNATVYIMSFINGMCIPIYFTFSDTNSITTSYVFFQMFTLGSPVSALVLLFLPPIIPLFRNPTVNFKYRHFGM